MRSTDTIRKLAAIAEKTVAYPVREPDQNGNQRFCYGPAGTTMNPISMQGLDEKKAQAMSAAMRLSSLSSPVTKLLDAIAIEEEKKRSVSAAFPDTTRVIYGNKRIGDIAAPIVDPETNNILESKANTAAVIGSIQSKPAEHEASIKDFLTKRGANPEDSKQVLAWIQKMAPRTGTLQASPEGINDALIGLIKQNKDTGIVLQLDKIGGGIGTIIIRPEDIEKCNQCHAGGGRAFLEFLAEKGKITPEELHGEIVAGTLSWQELIKLDKSRGNEGSFQFMAQKPEAGKPSIGICMVTGQECMPDGMHLGNTVFARNEEIYDRAGFANPKDKQDCEFAFEYILDQMLQLNGKKEGTLALSETSPIFSTDILFPADPSKGKFVFSEINDRPSYVMLSAFSAIKQLAKKGEDMEDIYARAVESGLTVPPEVYQNEVLMGRLDKIMGACIEQKTELLKRRLTDMKETDTVCIPGVSYGNVKADGTLCIDPSFIFPHFKEQNRGIYHEFLANIVNDIKTVIAQDPELKDKMKDHVARHESVTTPQLVSPLDPSWELKTMLSKRMARGESLGVE